MPDCLNSMVHSLTFIAQGFGSLFMVQAAQSNLAGTMCLLIDLEYKSIAKLYKFTYLFWIEAFQNEIQFQNGMAFQNGKKIAEDFQEIYKKYKKINAWAWTNWTPAKS